MYERPIRPPNRKLSPMPLARLTEKNIGLSNCSGAISIQTLSSFCQSVK
jgi:hypothetical protein